MQKIKVPMQCQIDRLSRGFEDFTSLFDTKLRITLTPQPIQQIVNASPNDRGESAEYVQLTFNRYLRSFLNVNIQNLDAIRYLLTSTRVDNAFDMITLVKQLVPMLDEAISQADPENYELEIIR
jgi:hypothetical protein